MNVIAYLRVSTDEQAASGLGMDAQRAKIQDEADRKGWHVTWCVDEAVSGKATNRPGLTEALRLLANGEAEALVVAKMDRLARSVLQASDVLETARKQKWSVVILDLGMDLSTPHGKAMAQMLAVFAELEREMIAQRTREALAAAKARGQRLGRPRATSDGVVAQAVALAATGLSHRQVATALTQAAVPTTRGAAAWSPSTVRRLLDGHALDQATQRIREPDVSKTDNPHA
jgi:DNA invertase Pin-like site-specific DNA recombinase